MTAERLEVTSHVGRDMLQSAALFRHAHQVVWEYVSNGLQYVDPGVQPQVKVSIQTSPKRILIEDNGRGMDRSDLARFFTMHAENEDRRSGRAGRGFFGTGKSAAFAIAERLTIRTVRDGRRSVVDLRRSALEAQTSGAPVPVILIENEVPTDEPNGTRVEIDDLFKVRLDRGEIEHALERQVRFWRGAEVVLNGRPIEPVTPPSDDRREFVAGTSEHPELRGAMLILHIAKRPLTDDEQGVAVTASGVLLETTLAGAERKEMANYLFGEIDVPALYAQTGVDAFDMSRSGRLNPENALVAAVHAFIGKNVEVVRRALVEEERKRRAERETARLQKEADRIARIINEDYADFSRRFAAARSTAVGATDLVGSRKPALQGEEVFLFGGDEPAAVVGEEPRPPSDQSVANVPTEDTPLDPEVEPAAPDTADASGQQTPTQASRPRRAGGFQVQYRRNGPPEPRAFYAQDSRTIFINLDHPQLEAAVEESGTDDPTFRRLSYEIAFTEYAIGFAQENAAAGWYMAGDHTSALTDMRERIDSVARRAADLFRTR